MNYGQLRSIFVGKNALTANMAANLNKEVQKIVFYLFGEASSSHKNEVEVSSETQVKIEKLLESLPKGLTFFSCCKEKRIKGLLGSDPEKTIRDSFAM